MGDFAISFVPSLSARLPDRVALTCLFKIQYDDERAFALTNLPSKFLPFPQITREVN
jgi:hypothetical protein